MNTKSLSKFTYFLDQIFAIAIETHGEQIAELFLVGIVEKKVTTSVGIKWALEAQELFYTYMSLGLEFKNT